MSLLTLRNSPFCFFWRLGSAELVFFWRNIKLCMLCSFQLRKFGLAILASFQLKLWHSAALAFLPASSVHNTSIHVITCWINFYPFFFQKQIGEKTKPAKESYKIPAAKVFFGCNYLFSHPRVNCRCQLSAGKTFLWCDVGMGASCMPGKLCFGMSWQGNCS